MLELVNISNYSMDNDMIHNNARTLRRFLRDHGLDGIEMMLCAPRDPALHPKDCIKGAHLRFWPNWLDFWLNNKEPLLDEFGSEQAIQKTFGGLRREDWLKLYQDNIRESIKAGARYVVFHVSQARMSEIFRRHFFYNSAEVIRATVDVVNELCHCIPEDVTILFENLWWPGLTLRDRELAEKLLSGVRHANAGFMLDTGHLMNTRLTLQSQVEGVEYVLHTIRNMGNCREYIRGLHLSCSLSGTFVEEMKKNPPAGKPDGKTVMSYVLKTDQHLPFADVAVQKLIKAVRPEFLVHEFMQRSLADWSDKVCRQKRALGHELPERMENWQ